MTSIELHILKQLLLEQPGRQVNLELMKEVLTRTVADAHTKYLELFKDFSVETCKQIVKSSAQGCHVTIDSPALTYGEVDFNSYAAILALLDPAPSSVLVDLGSGVGKAVIATALLYGSTFRRVHGIEIIRELFEASDQVCAEYRRLVSNPDCPYNNNNNMCEVTFALGDFLTQDNMSTRGEYLDWTKADIVFANSTCFDADLMRRIADCASSMRPGTRLVTLTCELSSDHFELQQKHIFSMSWGAATCFIYIRK